jgi:peptide chain release factor 2
MTPTSSRSSCAICACGSASSGGVFDLDSLRARLEALDQESARPDLWDDREAAQKVLREKSRIERDVTAYDRIAAIIEDAEVLLQLATEADDAETLGEVGEKLGEADGDLADAELRRMLGGEQDAANAIVSINSGAGGTDACDWAEMLLRMYLRWAERRGYKTEVLDVQGGDEAGLRSATFTVTGEYAYGYLDAEEGVHRLVRISPFDSQARRHTAFASVSVFPEIDDDIEVEIEEKDLRIDTYRSSGAGGQHVNKTDSAVRITHFPSGIVVQCQNERSQHKNRAAAMKILRARLYEHARREREAALESARGEQRQIEFGSQIRSYTLHPQQRVKDHRTDVESGNIAAVLDGNLDAFIRAMLLQRAGSAKEAS